jgi:hypothetical protein
MNESTPQHNNHLQEGEKWAEKPVEGFDALVWHIQTGLQNAETALEDIENTAHTLKTIESSVGLDTESIDAVKNELRIDDALLTISERAFRAYTKTVHALKNACIVGLAGMTLAGYVEVEGKEIKYTDHSKVKRVESVSYGQKVSDNLIARMKSKTYLERLTKETNGDVEEAKKIQQARINNVERVRIIYFKDTEELNALVKGRTVNGLPNSNYKLEAFTDYRDNGVKNPIVGVVKESDSTRIDHELSHVATWGDELIPLATQNRLRSLLRPEYVNSGHEKYARMPTEILARKHAIEAKMEKLHIKKYSEPYTKNHFETLLTKEFEEIGLKNASEIESFIHDGSFAQDGELVTFIQNGGDLPEGIEFVILYGLENIEKLFNEIAQKDGADTSETSENLPA